MREIGSCDAEDLLLCRLLGALLCHIGRTVRGNHVTEASVDADRRKALRQRRVQLQQSHQRDAVRNGMSQLVGELDAAGVRYRVLWSGEGGEPEETLRFLARFPFAFLTVDWAAVSDARKRVAPELCEKVRLFGKMVLEAVNDGGRMVRVTWPNAALSTVEMEASEVIVHAAILLNADFDTWAFAAGEDWIVEAHHDGNLHFGHAPRGESADRLLINQSEKATR
jgi:hypothetical protein